MEPRRLLDLFSGTGSATKWALAHGFEAVSLDILKKSKATHTVDILQWDYRMYPPNYFEIICSSPPCTQYSQARTTGPPRDLVSANAIVLKTLEIVDYFKPKLWTLENPHGGLLKKQAFMIGLECVVIDYCQFHSPIESFLYRKRTCFWTNRPKPNRLCDGACAGICAHPLKKKHLETFGGVHNYSLNKKHRVPSGVFEYLLGDA